VQKIEAQITPLELLRAAATLHPSLGSMPEAEASAALRKTLDILRLAGEAIADADAATDAGALLRKKGEAQDAQFAPREPWTGIEEAFAWIEDRVFVVRAAEALEFQSETARANWIDRLPARIKTLATFRRILSEAGAIERITRANLPKDDPAGVFAALENGASVEVTKASAVIGALRAWETAQRKMEAARRRRKRGKAAHSTKGGRRK
jgi:hypothetical protein